MSLYVPALAQDRVIGEAVNTDITAYVDGVPICSYNIGG